MDLKVAHAVIRDALTFDAGRFYSSGKGLSIGVGLLYKGVRYPIYNPDEELFETDEGVAFILTHECDVDPANARPFAEYLLVCPVIRFERLVDEYSSRLGDERLRGFLVELARRNISRVLYLPWGLSDLPYGGAIYLNQITSTHLSALAAPRAIKIGATTSYGLRIVDQHLTNHLLRPKAEELALSQ